MSRPWRSKPDHKSYQDLRAYWPPQTAGAADRLDSYQIQHAAFRADRHFSESVHKFPVNLKRNQPGALSDVDSGIIERPLTSNTFAGTGECD